MLRKLFLFEGDSITVNEFLATKDPHYEDSVDYKDTHFLMTPTLMRIDEEGDQEPLHYFEDENARRHIEIRYVHRIINYEEQDKDKKNVQVPLNIKECTEADFSDNLEMMEVYELNQEQGLSLYCPDFTDHKD
jgi:hypothetical protein